MSVLRRAIMVVVMAFSCLSLLAQESDKDSLVRLLDARSARLIQSDGQDLRKVIGPARFLHNNTYLLCDTALWNVNTKVIDAIGNVSIIQDGTTLTSDKMVYLVDQDLAQFRGHIVELRDKDNNILRTRHLDYNTKDSVAVFENGGAMRDKDGQIIESLTGTYDSKEDTFVFTGEVNMFTDSIFVKTTYLKYESDRNLATFGSGTDAWKDDSMLSSEAGWYDRNRELFFFRRNVHVMSPNQEGWSDSLFFHRMTTEVEMLGNAQVTDTTRNIIGVAGRIHYVDSTARVKMTRQPAVIVRTEEDGKRDTVYIAADTLIYKTTKYCDIDSVYLVDAEKRLKELDGDPVSVYRRKAAEAAAKAAEEARKNDPNYRPPTSSKPEDSTSSDVPEPPAPSVPSDKSVAPQSQEDEHSPLEDGLQEVSDSLGFGLDSLGFGADSLAVGDSLGRGRRGLGLGDGGELSDSLATSDSTVIEPVDTTKYGFLTALRKVRIFRREMQIVCDSLEYSDVDSLVRLFNEPIIWNEISQQYISDSVSAVIRNGAIQKAHLMSDAFIHIQEDETHFDQIRGAELIAYFDSTGALYRFDALGGASGLFFLKENDALATVNKKEAKMFSIDFKDGNMERIRYYDGSKSDAFPIVQLSKDEQMLKGFNWTPEKRPQTPADVTTVEPRTPQRWKYEHRPHASFKETAIYFPGYIDDIHRQIAVRDSLARVRRAQREWERLHPDTTSTALDDVLDDLVDSLSAQSDSLVTVKDTLGKGDDGRKIVAKDSLSTPEVLTKEQLKAKKKAEAAARREAARKARKEAREARNKALDEAWEKKEQKRAEKKAAKEAAKQARIREHKRKALIAADKQERADAAVLDKYVEKYTKQDQKRRERNLSRRRPKKFVRVPVDK